MTLTSKGSATKELRILKTMIKSLEGDLMREKTKYQKASHKRTAEHRRLLDEVSKIKSFNNWKYLLCSEIFLGLNFLSKKRQN